MTAYYNEIDPHAAAWLRNLIRDGLVAPGEVDTRSIKDVRPADLKGFTQCHFFAGIGGWSAALRRAGWPDSRPVWTGSCPCQPFSSAGVEEGMEDPRHLWPTWFRIIEKCRPRDIFGEQVEAAIRFGWLDLVCSNLERIGYTVGASVFPAAGVGSPNIRSRAWFVAYADGHRGECEGADVGAISSGAREEAAGKAMGHAQGGGRGERGGETGAGSERHADRAIEADDPRRCRGCDGLCTTYCRDEFDTGEADPVADSPGPGSQRSGSSGSARPRREGSATERGCEAGALSDAYRAGRGAVGGRGLDLEGEPGPHAHVDHEGNGSGRAGAVDNTVGEGLERQPWHEHCGGGQQDSARPTSEAGLHDRPGPCNGFWKDAEWLPCRDGKWRPAEPGIAPLVNGLSFRLGSGSTYEGRSRSGMLKGYGNGINVEAAAAFIEAFQDIETAGF